MVASTEVLRVYWVYPKQCLLAATFNAEQFFAERAFNEEDARRAVQGDRLQEFSIDDLEAYDFSQDEVLEKLVLKRIESGG